MNFKRVYGKRDAESNWKGRFFLFLTGFRNTTPRLLMSRSSIEPNGLHYPDVLEHPRDGIIPVILESSPCYFAGCVPNEPCKVEAIEKNHLVQLTNLDDLVY